MKKNILMLDDDLVPLSEGVTEERMRLQPWLRWLKTGQQAEKFNLIECNSLKSFIDELTKLAFSDPDDGQHIHALIIDMMLKKTAFSEKTFSLINYPDIEVLPLEAGAQLLRLMFESESRIPSFLSAFTNLPIAALSSLRKSEISLDEFPNNVEIMHKTTEEKRDGASGNLLASPNSEFEVWIEKLG